MDEIINLSQSKSYEDIIKLNLMINNPKYKILIQDFLVKSFLSKNMNIWINIENKIKEFKNKLYNDFIKSQNIKSTDVTISGPVSLHILQLPNERYLVLFGDNHEDREGKCNQKCNRHDILLRPIIEENSNCYTILYWLQKFFKRNKQLAIKSDFFLETRFLRKDVSNSSQLGEIIERGKKYGSHAINTQELKQLFQEASYLNIVDVGFEQYVTHKNISEEYGKYLRIHRMDIRQPILTNKLSTEYTGIFGLSAFTSSKEAISEALTNLVNKNLTKNDTILLAEFLMNNIKLVEDFLIDGMDYNNFRYEIIERFKYSVKNISVESSNKFFNNLNRLEKMSSMRDNKKMFITAKELYELNKLGKDDISGNIKEYFRTKLDEEAEHVLNMINTQLYSKFTLFKTFDALIMDIYVLSRMYKYDDSKYLVFYMGDGHIERYLKFFRKYTDYKVLESVKGEAPLQRCIKTMLLDTI